MHASIQRLKYLPLPNPRLLALLSGVEPLNQDGDKGKLTMYDGQINVCRKSSPATGFDNDDT